MKQSVWSHHISSLHKQYSSAPTTEHKWSFNLSEMFRDSCQSPNLL